MTDRETLAVYGAKSRDYEDVSGGEETAGDIATFLHALPDGDGPVLDWGAGPGHDAAAMQAAGLACEATDATPEMVALMARRGVTGRCEPFEALKPISRYRGIWANFSLLHAGPDALPGLIRRAAGALLPGGLLHMGMKRGSGTRRDTLGRRYTYVEAEDLDRLTGDAGLIRIATRTGRAVGLDGQAADYLIHLSRKTDA